MSEYACRRRSVGRAPACSRAAPRGEGSTLLVPMSPDAGNPHRTRDSGPDDRVGWTSVVGWGILMVVGYGTRWSLGSRSNVCQQSRCQLSGALTCQAVLVARWWLWAASATLVPIDPLPSLSMKLKWEGPLLSGVSHEAVAVLG